MILFAQTGTFDFATLASPTDPHGVVHAFAGNTTLRFTIRNGTVIYKKR